MSPALGKVSTVRNARDFLWRHPEWWALALSALAWIWLAAAASMDQHRHHREPSIGGSLLHWAIMIPAMMYPFLTGHLRLVAVRSFWNRRDRGIAGFLAGYSAVWLAFAPVAAVAALLPFEYALPASLAAAALWQFTPWKRSAMFACHRTNPLAPEGIRADLDCIRYGAFHARSCWITCWPVMLVCAVAHRHLLAMPALTLVMYWERAAPHGSDPRRKVAGLFAVALVLTLALS